MSKRDHVYRFASAAHWRRCLMHGLIPGNDGTLRLRTPAPQWAALPGAAEPSDCVALHPLGAAFWRLPATTCSLTRFKRSDHPSELNIEGIIARGQRWVADHTGLWSFDGCSVCRHLADTLEPDFTHPFSTPVLDIASDGHDGLFVLMEGAPLHLEHIDAQGHVGKTAIPLPVQYGDATRLAPLGRQGLALLDANTLPNTLHFLRLTRQPPDYAWKAEPELDLNLTALGKSFTSLGSDGDALTLLWNRTQLALIDPAGDWIDLPQLPDGIHISDAAVRGGTLYIATSSGVMHLGLQQDTPAPGGRARLVTPVLTSPGIGSDKGWSRAEIVLAAPLPRGARITAHYLSTHDPLEADGRRSIADNAALPVTARQERLMAPAGRITAHDRHRGHTFIFDPDNGAGPVLDLPLYTCEDTWLWLELTIESAADTPPPVIRELRVRYPNVSLAENMPAIYSDARHDPYGLARDLLGILEASTQALDARIGDIGTRIDPDSAPPARLDAMARWLGLPWHDGLPEAARRTLLKNASPLAAERGTRAGLRRLLACLLGEEGVERITDTVCDQTPLPLGGPDSTGPRLPLRLAGLPTGLAHTNGQARLDATRLPGTNASTCPLQSITPTVHIHLAARRDTRQQLTPLLDGLIADFVPSGLAWRIHWRQLPPFPIPHDTLRDEDGNPLLLEANGPAILEQDSQLGRIVLAGHPARRLEDHGLPLAFRLL